MGMEKQLQELTFDVNVMNKKKTQFQSSFKKQQKFQQLKWIIRVKLNEIKFNSTFQLFIICKQDFVDEFFIPKKNDEYTCPNKLVQWHREKAYDS